MAETYKGTNVKLAKTIKIIELIEELFKNNDLNDNSSKDFNSFIIEIKDRFKSSEKEIKEIKTQLSKSNKAKDFYKKRLMDSMKKSDLSKMIEELVE